MNGLRGGFLSLAAGSLLGVVACATTPGPSALLENLRLLKRAALDLDCAGGPLITTTLDAKTRVVRGCGRRAIYVQLCDGPENQLMRSCVWARND